MNLLPALVGGSRVKTLKIGSRSQNASQFLDGLAPPKDARGPSFLLRTKAGADASSRRPPPYWLPLFALAQQCSRGTQSCLPTSHNCILICIKGPSTLFAHISLQGLPNFQVTAPVG